MTNENTMKELIAGSAANRWVSSISLDRFLKSKEFSPLTDPLQIGQSHFEFRVWGCEGDDVRRMLVIRDPINDISCMAQVLNLDLFIQAGRA
jgi:hypothetical protein